MLPKLFFTISTLISSFTFTYSHTQCLHHQKTLLLQFKNDLIFDSSFSTKLVQWNQTDDCCSWHGVACDAAGNVVSLHLDDEAISGGIGDSSTLFRLAHLQKLNLAYNNFNSTPIPRAIHNLTYLTHFNLSNAGFGGQVPAEISSLRRLASLDLSNDYWDIDEPLRLEHPNMEMLLQNMTSITELYLDGVFLSSHERRKWSHIVSSSLPNLTGLSLVWCSLSGPLAKSFSRLHSLSVLRLDSNNLSAVAADMFINFSSLTTLSLFNSGLKGSFPSKIFQIPSLQYLDLSGNEMLSGSIPPFPQTGSLKSLLLRATNFSGSLPNSIGNLRDLSEINLGGCKFTGSLPSSFANLTELMYVNLSYNFFTGSLSSALFGGLLKLVRLDLLANSFSGNLPHSLFSLPLLEELYLSQNQFIGLVEEFSIVNGSNIAILDLSSNRLEGPIPDSLFQLQSLESLLLFGNLLNGSFQLDMIQKLSSLTLLDLSDNNLSVLIGNISSSSYGFPQLNELRLASCNVYDFPEFIKHSDDLSTLDLSNNRIGGEIPSWIWGTQLQFLLLSFNLLTHLQKPYHIPASLQLLDLNSNKLRGELQFLIPQNTENIISNLQYLLLASNNLSGSIPTSLCSATKLSVLDLSANKLSGSIPPCLVENVGVVLDLRKNNISGRIPDKFPLGCSLQYLDLNSNALQGKIPKSLERCKLLEFMNVANNLINDTFPCILSLRVLVLHSNRFHGEVRCHKSWPDLQIVDVSSNNFSGSLESINLSSWRGMVLDSVRYNRLTSKVLKVSSFYKGGVRLIMKGQAVELVKIWPDFTAVDFSCNNFQGQIPNAIGDLRSLRLLNFSHNALSGSIPKSFDQIRNLESLDLSENQLTGEIPTELAGLTFLSVLNLSYNKLVGEIPNGRQFQTFSADSFKGNPGLCGFNLNITCSDSDGSDHLSPQVDENGEEKSTEIEWEYVCAALGYVVGLGIIVWLLLFSRSFREKYFGKVEEVFEDICDARDKRRRRRRQARRVVRNQVRRH
ncbi:receptor-like protein 7 [Salvia miltiorrhiza]|uniref:receptor-like protein 7 n=1 Tax=Salvia miltiorrhiza TaxID=226208 RepID=UPI0025ABF5E0|nr:receptor-like protein 7 [Salvia miltiorrhiza]